MKHILAGFFSKTSYLLHQKNHDFSEDLHKVNEKVEGMSDEVSVASSSLFNDHLGIPHDESTEHKESSPQVDLIHKKGKFAPYSVILKNRTWKISWDWKKMFKNPSQNKVESPLNKVPPK